MKQIGLRTQRKALFEILGYDDLVEAIALSNTYTIANHARYRKQRQPHEHLSKAATITSIPSPKPTLSMYPQYHTQPGLPVLQNLSAK
jgi:hypothetical protein